MAYRRPVPGKERTERNRALKKLRSKTDPGLDRAKQAATLCLEFHEERSINHVMELAAMVLGDVDASVEILATAYLHGVETDEDQMERLAMLANVGRWVDHRPLEQYAKDVVVEIATRWVLNKVDEYDRLDRLTTVERRFDAETREKVAAAIT